MLHFFSLFSLIIFYAFITHHYFYMIHFWFAYMSCKHLYLCFCTVYCFACNFWNICICIHLLGNYVFFFFGLNNDKCTITILTWRLCIKIYVIISLYTDTLIVLDNCAVTIKNISRRISIVSTIDSIDINKI